MGLKWVFMTMFSVLAHPETFWKKLRESHEEVNPMKDYAAPVIATVQLFKLPLVGVPKSAMILAIVSFVVDVAVLYVLSGAISKLAGLDRQAPVQERVLTLLCYSLTPVWLAEPFYFSGSLRWIFAAVALLYALVIMRHGLQAMLDREVPHLEALTGKTTLLTIVATMASFTAISGLIRIFTPF
ncbi:MAG: hypothetical protein HGB29_06435 [Chlorobiaceae bacterium]|nr:hypothetical protein [Chlorobiaceae bacterium]